MCIKNDNEMLTKNSIIFFTWKQCDKRAKKTKKNRLGDTLAWMESLCLLPLSVNSPLSHGGHIVPEDQKSFVLPR